MINTYRPPGAGSEDDMAWNPAPEVAVARDAARKLGARKCVIIYITDEHFGMASYGETKALCAEAGKLGDALYDETRRYLENE